MKNGPYRESEKHEHKPTCPLCGAAGEVEWIQVGDFFDDDQWLPGRVDCSTERCLHNPNRSVE